MSTVKPKIRIEFERSISPANPKDLIKQKLIMNDMGFYQRALILKISQGIDMSQLYDDDVIVIRYGLDGERQIDVGKVASGIALKIKDIAEGVFPSNYKNAKK
jgi:hypothetical protein